MSLIDGRQASSEAFAPDRGKAEAGGSRSIRPLLEMLPLIARYRARAIGAIAALLVASLAMLAVPIAVRRMVDYGFAEDRIGLIHEYFTALIAVAGVLAVASALRYYYVTVIGERIVADLRARAFDHLTALSASFFDNARTGELLSRLTADTTQIKVAVGTSISVALRNLVLFIGSAVMMVVTSPRLSLFVIIAIPVIVLPLVAFAKMVRRRSRTAQDSLADASAYAGELIGAVRVLQAFTNEKLANSRFSTAVDRAYLAALGSTRARAWLTAVVIFLVFASIVLVLWVGAQDVLDQRITAGRLSQFLLYAVFAAGALGEMSQMFGEISQAAGAAERLKELLAVKPVITAPPHPTPLPKHGGGEVAFDRVRFAYPARPETSVLDDVSFNVRPGEKVAIVGPSGAGKSTIFHLLLRFYDPDSGNVTFDGVRLADVDPHALRARIALVPQDAMVFASSIADNIRFGRPDASEDDIRRAAELAAASDFITRLPQGYETMVGERGRDAVGRRAAAACHRTRDPACSAAAAARRGDLLARRRERDAGAGSARAADAGPYHLGDRAPAGDGALLRPHPGDGSRPHR